MSQPGDIEGREANGARGTSQQPTFILVPRGEQALSQGEAPGLGLGVSPCLPRGGQRVVPGLGRSIRPAQSGSCCLGGTQQHRDADPGHSRGWRCLRGCALSWGGDLGGIARSKGETWFPPLLPFHTWLSSDAGDPGGAAPPHPTSEAGGLHPLLAVWLCLIGKQAQWPVRLLLGVQS